MPISEWRSIPWAEADHTNHPAEPHHCRCRCDTATDRACPEHGERVTRPNRVGGDADA